MSKRSDAIRVMKANEGKSMADVVKLIATEISVTEANAKSYYRWIVTHNMAPGTIEKTARAPKAARSGEPKAKKPKLIKVPKPKVQGDKPKVTDKTVEELADIRAKNLARLRAVGKKYQKGQYAEPTATGVENFDENEARAEIANMENDLDSFKAPKFLNMSQVRALV